MAKRREEDLAMSPCMASTKLAIKRFLEKLKADNEKSLKTATRMRRMSGGAFYDNQVEYHTHVRGFLGNAIKQNERRRVRSPRDGSET